MWVDFAIHASFPQLTWHDCINEYACEYPWFVVFSSVLRISILVLASVVVSIFEHSISFVCAFIVILLLLFFCLLGNAGIHILLTVYDCCNFHCSMQLTRWLFRVRPFSSFLLHMLSQICRSIFWSLIFCLY